MIKISSAIFKTFFLSLCIVANTHFAFGQTASILPPGYTQYLDSNGKPLSAGKVYNYVPNTTTLKTTWQDAAETIPNANPVILDAAGRAKILGDGSYRQIVKDRNNVTIWDAVTSSTGSGSSSPTATGDGDLVGTIKPWAGMTAPNQYAFTYGQEVSRTTYAALYTAITSSQSVFCNSGSPTLNGLTDTTNFWIGMSVEVSCVAAGFSTIVSKTSSTVVLAANANVTTNTTAVFYPWGRGNGTTTFNLPDLRGVVPAGNNNMGGVASANLTTTYFGATSPNSIGALGGSQSKALIAVEIPGHNHPVFLNDPGHNHTTDAKILPGGAVIQAGAGVGAGSAVVNSNTTGITIRDTSSGFGTADQTNYTGGGIAVSATLGNTGSGYTNGSQTITVTGGTCTTQPQFTVTVAGNVFTGTPALLTAGDCTVAPTNPAATSGGGGTGGTLTVTYNAQPFSLVQPTRTTNFIIKVTPDTNSATASGVTSLGGMTGDIACGVGLICTGNTVSTVAATNNLIIGSTTISSGTNNGILFNNAGILGNTAAANDSVLVTNGSGVPSFATSASISGSWTASAFIPSGSGVPANGMYLPAANTLGFATDGSGKMQANATGNVGIPTATLTDRTLSVSKSMTGATVAYGIISNGVTQSDVTVASDYYRTTGATAAAAFTLGQLNHYSAAQGTIGAGSTVTIQRGFEATNTLTGATTNYGFYGDIAAGTNRWNFYANGTAPNYMAGALAIGTTSVGTTRLVVAGAHTAADSFHQTDSPSFNSGTTFGTTVFSFPSVGAGAALTNLNHFRAEQGTLTGTVTNQYGFTANSGLTGATNNYGFYGNIAAGTNRWNFYANGTAPNYMAGALGIGTTSVTGYGLRVGKSITGAVSSYGTVVDGTVQSDVTTSAQSYRSAFTTQAAAFTLPSYDHFFATQGAIGAGSAVTNQYGFRANTSLTGATNNYGFFGDIAAAANRWNFYANGTARNWFGGNVGIVASGYINWGTTDGSSGQGIRQSGGIMQIANTAGTWNNVATNSGVLTNGNCVSINSTGQFVDAGGACTVGGGGGTVAAATINQVAVYTAATTVGGVTLNATATPMYLKQTSSGVPSFAQVAFTDLSLGTQTANTVFSGPASGGAATPAFRALVAADIPTTTMVDAVTAYGLVGDDSTNNDSAISTMVTAINSGNLTVYIRPGSYRYSNAWPAITSTGGAIICAQHSAIFRSTSTTNNGISIGSSVPTQSTNFRLAGCKFRPTVVKTAGNEVIVDGGSYVPKLDDLYFEYVYNPIRVTFGTNVYINRPVFRYITGICGICMLGVVNKPISGVSIYGGSFDNPYPLTANISQVKAYAALTAYNQGDMVNVNNYIWQVQTAGTTGGASSPATLPATNETSPSTDNVTDGTVAWRWISSNSLAWILADSYTYSVNIVDTRAINGAYGYRMQDTTVTAACGSANASCPWWFDLVRSDADHAFFGAVYLASGRGFTASMPWLGSTLAGNGITEDANYIGETVVTGGEISGGAQHGVLLNNPQGLSSIYTGIKLGFNGQATAATFSGIATAASRTNWSATNLICGANNTTAAAATNDTQNYCVAVAATNSACLVATSRANRQVAGSGAAGFSFGACSNSANY